ncbi:hypothetical protein S40293_03832 [Stachybotrys chartarum IBT 40293]|nr:hypothetical protein S40293_03832 [Stachybotrys chartarum IBT 40293]
MSWGLSTSIALIFSIIGFWWLLSSRSIYLKAIYALVCGLAFLIDPQHLVDRFHRYQAGYDPITDPVPYVSFLIQHSDMVLTLGAVAWLTLFVLDHRLLYRSWQTLRKPVPELINILGVDVPEPPDVCLAGIRADAATLIWTRPANNRPVSRYIIQVNGVQVGVTPGFDVAITVTGLKPSHFYNIRVVAVGPNNFQAGSQVVRLRTFRKDGLPHLGGGRLPTNWSENDVDRAQNNDESDDSETPKPSVPSIEAAPVVDGNFTTPRDSNTTTSGARRNTVNRRHSPSVASMDQPSIRPQVHHGPELSLDELNSKFEAIRKEIEDTQSLYAKEQTEFQQQEDELKQEKERKRRLLKEKEEQTAQLKGMVRTTMEQMRAAEKERAKLEQQLKDKQSKIQKVREVSIKLENEIERMKKEREGFAAEEAAWEEKRDRDVQELDESIGELQESCTELESELKDKGKLLQDLKEAREQLPGADDEQWMENDAAIRREWEMKRKELHDQLVAETKKAHQLDQHIRILGEQLSIQQQSGLTFYNQREPPDVDMNPLGSTQSKRQSLNSNPLSPPLQVASAEPQYKPSGFNTSIGFAPALFMGIPSNRSNEHHTEAEMRAASGPLSPTAHTLLPSDIFDDTENLDSKSTDSPFLPESVVAAEEDPQSPSSSSRSFSAISSPRGSSYNLPFPQYTDASDARSIKLNSPPAAPSATGHRLTNLLSTFQRSRGPKGADEDGPLFGTLKAGQSQSFPRGTDEADLVAGTRRRLSFSLMNRNSTDVNGAFGRFGMGSRASSRLMPGFASSSSPFFADRDPEVSRPASIASSDLPRPSTDSGSIWGAPGDMMGMAKNRLWSPGDARWASRNASRHPSRHGSPSALTTTLASADDEILDEDDLLDPQTSPSQIGVIGSRPPGLARSMGQRLNPNAPTFMGNVGNIFRRDKGKDVAAEKDKAKGKEKEKGKDKTKDAKSKGKDPSTPSTEFPLHSDDSPSDSRISRDTFSVHTQTSVSESHESLPLDATASNTPSDVNSISTSNLKDQENVVRKLFRKGSSSKFSLSTRLGKDSSLFKKGPGSSGNSDKNTAEHRSSIGDLDDLGEDIGQPCIMVDSVAVSPSLGPSRSKDSAQGRMSSWRFGMKKKGKEKEGLEVDRPPREDE